MFKLYDGLFKLLDGISEFYLFLVDGVKDVKDVKVDDKIYSMFLNLMDLKLDK